MILKSDNEQVQAVLTKIEVSLLNTIKRHARTFQMIAEEEELGQSEVKPSHLRLVVDNTKGELV